MSALAERQRCEPRLGPGHLGVMANGDLQRSVLERNPLPPTYCYLKPWYLPGELGYFWAVDEGRL